MKIALLGASGRIGQRITLEALVRGHEVKALVRNPEGFPITHPHLIPNRILKTNMEMRETHHRTQTFFIISQLDC